jgi:hypothetical protein
MTANNHGKAMVARAGKATGYPKLLAQWVKQPTGKLRDRRLATFMAVRNDVKAALNAGFAAKTIWAHMRETGRVDFCYETFLRHVKRCADAAPAGKAVPIVEAKGRAAAEPVIVTAPVMPGFSFNPVPNKEALL